MADGSLPSATASPATTVVKTPATTPLAAAKVPPRPLSMLERVQRAETIRRVNAAEMILDAIEKAGSLKVDPTLHVSDEPVIRGGAKLIDSDGIEIALPKGEEYDRVYIALVDPTPNLRWPHEAWWAFVPAHGMTEPKLEQTTVPFGSDTAIRFVPINLPSRVPPPPSPPPAAPAPAQPAPEEKKGGLAAWVATKRAAGVSDAEILDEILRSI